MAWTICSAPGNICLRKRWTVIVPGGKKSWAWQTSSLDDSRCFATPPRKDSLLKAARNSNCLEDWAFNKSSRNKATNAIKSAKRKFYRNCFEENKDNAKGIKSLTSVNNKKNKDADMTSSKPANDFNNHFASIANRLRSMLPSVSFDRSKLEDFVKEGSWSKILHTHNKLWFCVWFCLKPNDVMGMDKLSARMLKLASDKLLPRRRNSWIILSVICVPEVLENFQSCSLIDILGTGIYE